MFMGKIKYELLKKDEKTQARLGKLYTNYGVCDTPMFMPVGTQATVKTLSVVPSEDVTKTTGTGFKITDGFQTCFAINNSSFNI